MSIFPEEIASKMANSNDWLSGKDFEGDGMQLQIISVEPVSSQFGVEEDDYWVEQGILTIGQTFRYTFKDLNDIERKWDTHSRPLAIGFQQAEAEANDWVRIVRTGTGKNTRYIVTKVEAPVPHTKTDATPNPEDIPF